MGIKNNIIRTLFGWILIPIYKLYFKLILALYKRATYIGLDLIKNLRYQILVLNPEARLEGYDEDLDQTVHIASLLVLKPEVFGIVDTRDSSDCSELVQSTDNELVAEYMDVKTDVDKLVEQISTESFVSTISRDYWLVRNYIETIRKNDTLAACFLSRASRLRVNTKPLDHRDLDSLKRKVKIENRRLRNLLADRDALKIDISAQGVVVLISLVSSLFLVSGYLYNFLLLREFGIDVSLYFTLTDYVAASLSRLSSIFVAALFTLFGYYLGIHSISRKSKTQLRMEGNFPTYRNYGLLVLLFSGSAIGYYSGNLQVFYDAGGLFIICVAMLILPHVCFRYFEKPIPALCGLVFTVSFTVSLWASVGAKLDILMYEEITKDIMYELKLKDGVILPSEEIKLIAGNSGYFFFLDKNRKPIILNKSQVEFLVRRKVENEQRGFLFFYFPPRNVVN